MEYDVILPDEMDQACARIAPIFTPSLRLVLLPGPFDSGGNVADWRIKPDIEDFPFRPFQRYGDSPIDVPRDGSVGQALLEPARREFAHVVFPVCFAGLPFG